MSIIDTKVLTEILFTSLTNHSSLEGIIHQIQAQTNFIIVLFDLNNRPLQFAPANGEKTAISKPSSYIFATEFTKTRGRINKMFRTGLSVLYEAGELDKHYYTCSPIYLSDKPEGIVTIGFSNRADCDLTAEIAKVLSRLYVYFSQPKIIEPGLESDFLRISLTRELLLNNGNIAETLFNDIYGFGTHGIWQEFSPGYGVVAIFDPSAHNDYKLLQKIEYSFGQLIHKSLHLINNGHIQAFVYGLNKKNYNTTDELFLQKMKTFAIHHHVCIAISATFNNLSERKGYKRQAQQAIRFMERNNMAGQVTTTDEWYTTILRSGAIDRVGPQILILSDIRKIVEYDLENNANYLVTLEQYLTHGNRLSLAAQSMFIDRGTMKYRLQKIQDIIEKDLDDPQIARHLHQAIAIFNLYKHV